MSRANPKRAKERRAPPASDLPREAVTTTRKSIEALWKVCDELRGGETTYLQYLTDLTSLLYLKMAKDTETEGELPNGYRWSDLVAKDGVGLLQFYRLLLIHLAANGSDRTRTLFADTVTSLRKPRDLRAIVEAVDSLDWYRAKDEGLREFYVELLERNAEETKSGTGLYFTPRHLVECMVALASPKAGELVQDPAVHVGGFLMAADAHIKTQTDGLFNLDERGQLFQRRHAFFGLEDVADLHRLALMNGLLHDVDAVLVLGDALGPKGAALPKADLILSNPPFGTRKCSRTDITYPTSNKQLVYLQHIYRGLKPAGRAAVVLPDNVLFEDDIGQKVRADLMDKCDLHTILRLPTGIFFAQGVKANVLFFTRGKTDRANTKAVWFYDMRTNAPSFGKRTPLTRSHFAGFEKAFGDHPFGKSKRKDQGEAGHFRRFTREDIAKREDNLDISWLRDDSVTSHADLPEPEVLVDEIAEQLRTALGHIEALGLELRTGA